MQSVVSVLAERETKKSKGLIKRDIKKKKKKPSVQRDIKPMNNTRSENVGTKMNINEQTVAKRRAARSEKVINPKSPEVKRGARRAQGYKIKKKKSGISRTALAYTVIFLTVFILISLVCGLLFYANLVKVDKPEYSRIRLKMGLQHEAEEIDDIGVDVSRYYRDGMFYVNMTAMAEEFDFLMTGDHEELRFITDEKKGEEVRFQLGTSFAVINTSSVKLDGIVEKIDGNVYVPASFITEYMNGIEFTFDVEESTISILRNTARNESGRFVKSDIGFKLQADKITNFLPEAELSEAEQAKCYFKNVSADEYNNLQQN